jgi:hypothetical protein
VASSEVVSMYVRTRGGRMVHRTNCRHASSASTLPWHWAEGKTPQQIWSECLKVGVLVDQCSRCMFAPLEDSETPDVP